jgi:hypothetical protein
LSGRYLPSTSKYKALSSTCQYCRKKKEEGRKEGKGRREGGRKVDYRNFCKSVKREEKRKAPTTLPQ